MALVVLTLHLARGTKEPTAEELRVGHDRVNAKLVKAGYQPMPYPDTWWHPVVDVDKTSSAPPRPKPNTTKVYR